VVDFFTLIPPLPTTNVVFSVSFFLSASDTFLASSIVRSARSWLAALLSFLVSFLTSVSPVALAALVASNWSAFCSRRLALAAAWSLLNAS
jgi:hypothetical protein